MNQISETEATTTIKETMPSDEITDAEVTDTKAIRFIVVSDIHYNERDSSVATSD